MSDSENTVAPPADAPKKRARPSESGDKPKRVRKPRPKVAKTVDAPSTSAASATETTIEQPATVEDSASGNTSLDDDIKAVFEFFGNKAHAKEYLEAVLHGNTLFDERETLLSRVPVNGLLLGVAPFDKVNDDLAVNPEILLRFADVAALRAAVDKMV